MNMKVSPGTFNMFGVYNGRDKVMKTETFVNKIGKMKPTLRIWSQYFLSLLGKLLISKSHGISNII